MLDRLWALIHREPVAVVNGLAALAAVVAGLGLDIDPDAIGYAVGALLVLAGVTRANVYSPDSVDDLVEHLNEVIADLEGDAEEAG